MEIDIEKYIDKSELEQIARHSFKTMCQARFRDDGDHLFKEIVRNVVWDEINDQLGGDGVSKLSKDFLDTIDTVGIFLEKGGFETLPESIKEIVKDAVRSELKTITRHEIVSRIFNGPVYVSAEIEY